jgi:hypothetical protein
LLAETGLSGPRRALVVITTSNAPSMFLLLLDISTSGPISIIVSETTLVNWLTTHA